MVCSAFSDRLYEPAIDSIVVTCNHVLSAGWRVVVVHRHSGEEWQTCPGDTYQHLTGSELVELVDAVLDSRVGYASP